MILDVLAVEIGQVELLHEFEQLCACETAESVTGQPQMDRRWLFDGL
jgi:hypothetical protein